MTWEPLLQAALLLLFFYGYFHYLGVKSPAYRAYRKDGTPIDPDALPALESRWIANSVRAAVCAIAFFLPEEPQCLKSFFVIITAGQVFGAALLPHEATPAAFFQRGFEPFVGAWIKSVAIRIGGAAIFVAAAYLLLLIPFLGTRLNELRQPMEEQGADRMHLPNVILCVAAFCFVARLVLFLSRRRWTVFLHFLCAFLVITSTLALQSKQPAAGFLLLASGLTAAAGFRFSLQYFSARHDFSRGISYQPVNGLVETPQDDGTFAQLIIDLGILAVICGKSDPIPPFAGHDRMYRYRVVDDWLESILVDHQLFHASPAAFKDPLDCKVHLDFEVTEEELRHFAATSLPYLRKHATLLKNHPVDPTGALLKEVLHGPDEQLIERFVKSYLSDPAGLADEMRKQLEKQTAELTRICCFTIRPNNLHMWSEYGAQGQGVALEFHFPKELASQVTYEEHLPTFRIFNLEDVQHVYQALLTKRSLHFAAEEEWRIVRYRERRGPIPFNPQWLTAIYFGWDCPPKERDRVRRLAQIGKLTVRYYEVTPKGEILPIPSGPDKPP